MKPQFFDEKDKYLSFKKALTINKKITERDVLTRVIGIVSGKGGVGKTTFSVNIGLALSRFNKKVLLIDCNITTPHLAYYLGADDYFITLNNIFRGEVDEKFAPLSHSGIAFIPASEELRDIIRIDFNKLTNHVKKLSENGIFDFIILDSAPGLGREAISVLKAADEVLFVTDPTIPNITDVVRCYEYLNMIKTKKVNIVFNKVREKDFELKFSDAQNFFEAPVLGAIPFDECVMDSTAQGIPFLNYMPNSHTSHHFMKVAANLMGVPYESPSSSRIKGIFRKLKGKIKREK
jgi:MinD-like ATPase involved in chromosome partitioning or flagellar assembly